jgi:hypothetical protein
MRISRATEAIDMLSEAEITAKHEAAHAVAAVALGLRIGTTSVLKDDPYCFFLKDGSKGDRIRGAIASYCPFLIDPGGSEEDLEYVAANIKSLQNDGVPFQIEFYKNTARDLMIQPRVIKAVNALAIELRCRETLTGDEATNIILKFL